MKKVNDRELEKVSGGSTWNDPGEIGSQQSIGPEPGDGEAENRPDPST